MITYVNLTRLNMSDPPQNLSAMLSERQ